MAELKPRWRFDMLGVSEDRRTTRIGTSSDAAALLVGIDGNLDGGIHPSTGFKDVVELEYGYKDDAALISSGGYKAGGVLAGIDGVTFRIGDSKYAYGWVYRVLNDTQDKAVIRLKIRIGSSTTWITDYDLSFPKGLLGGGEAYAGEQFHVQVFGRFVFVLRAGKEPLVFNINETSPDVFELIVSTDTGPGPAPVLGTPTINSAGAKVTAGGGRTANQDVTQILTAMTPPGTGDSQARILFFGFSNVFKVNGGGPDLTNPYLHVRNLPSPNQADEALKGPSDLGLWASPPQPDPAFGTVVWYQNGVPATPIYTTPHTEFEGLAYNRSASPSGSPQGLRYPPVWAYRLYDSRTGRFSGLSNRIQPNRDIYGQAGQEETVGTNSNGELASQVLPVSFPMFQVIYNKTRYDTLFLYRSKLNTDGLSPDEVVLSLEKQITLSDYHIDSQPVNPDWKVAAYFITLTDSELTQQPTWTATADYLEDMPKAGSALSYEGTMLFGKMSQLDTNTSGLGKVVWSSLLEISPELVSPSDYYPLYTPDEEVERFTRLGPNVAGFTRLGSYLFRRETQYMKGMAMHKGFGIVNHRAACEVGSDVYFITESGLNIISSTGKMQDLSAINHVIQTEWKDDLASVQMAYDQAASAVFILNPIQYKIIVLWLKNSRISEFYDTEFDFVCEADSPLDPEVSGSRLQRRATFVTTISPNGVDKFWRVFTYDYARSKDAPLTLNPSGNLIYTLKNALNFDVGQVDVNEAIATGIEKCRLYVLEGPYAGVSLRVLYKIDIDSIAIEARTISLPAGTRLGLSPMFVQWMGPMLGMENEQGMMFTGRDFNATRYVDGMRCAFTDVTNEFSAPSDLMRYQGAIYSGTNTLPTDARFPTDNRRGSVQSLEDGLSKYAVSFSDPTDNTFDARTGVQGNILFPSVKIFIPGVDYTLLSVSVTGTIRSEDAMRLRE